MRCVVSWSLILQETVSLDWSLRMHYCLFLHWLTGLGTTVARLKWRFMPRTFSSRISAHWVDGFFAVAFFPMVGVWLMDEMGRGNSESEGTFFLRKKEPKKEEEAALSCVCYAFRCWSLVGHFTHASLVLLLVEKQPKQI